MKKISARFLSVLIFSAAPLAAHALSSGADFLRAEIPARPAALGGAFVATQLDPTAFMWNPAALAWLTEPVLSATHFSSIVDTNFEHAALVQPVNIRNTRGGMGVSMQFSRTDDFEEIDLAGNPVGKVENFDLVGMVGYGFRVKKNFGLGVNVKGFGSRLAEFEARGFAVDVGVQFKIHRRWQLGIAFNDLGVQQAFSEESDPLPTLLRIGVQTILLDSPEGLILGMAEVNRPWTTQNGITAGLGVEYWYQDSLAFRVGYRAGELLGNLTLGLGYRWSGLDLDYAYVPLGDLGITHRFSMGVKLGTLYERFAPYHAKRYPERPHGNRQEEKFKGRKIKVPERLR
jgi:opacity protein-like surface antigen